MVREAAGELARRLVGLVRIVDVYPCEPRAPLRADPLERSLDHGVRRTLTLGRLAGRAALRHAVVVEIEARRQPEAAIERKAADEGRRGEAPRLQQRCGGRFIRAQPVS